MSDSYISKLEGLLNVLNNIIQTVPEAKKLLDSVGVNPSDLEPVVRDRKTGEVLGPKTEAQSQRRFELSEARIAENEKLNQLIKERTALMQQEANAAKQVNAVTTAARSSEAPTRRTRGPARSRQSTPTTAKEIELEGEFGVVAPVLRGAGPSPRRVDVLENDSDVASLKKSEIEQLRTTIRTIAKKLVAAGSSRGKALLESIKPGSSPVSVVNAFEEAMTSVVQKSDEGFQPIGQVISSRMGSIDSFRRAIGSVKQIVKEAASRPIVKPDRLATTESSLGYTRTGSVRLASDKVDEDGQDGEALRVNTDQRATGISRRRAIHNTFGRVRDAIRYRLGIPTGKGNEQDLRIQQDRNAGSIEAAGSADMLQEGVDLSIKKTMQQVIDASIDDVKAGRVSAPSSGRGGIVHPAIPNTLKAILVKYAPQIEAASNDTTARGALGKERGGIGVFGAPDAQNTLVGLFGAMLAARISQPSVGKTPKEQEQALKNINVDEVFQSLFAPDAGSGKSEATTSVAGITHRRVLEDLQKKVRDAEESYLTETDEELKKQKMARLRIAQGDLRTYQKLDEKPVEIPVDPTAPPARRATDATMSMRYRMAQSQLREDLKAKYLTGTTTAELVQQGVRTATTRAGGDYKPGQIIEIPEAPGTRYQVTSVDKPDFSTP